MDNSNRYNRDFPKKYTNMNSRLNNNNNNNNQNKRYSTNDVYGKNDSFSLRKDNHEINNMMAQNRRKQYGAPSNNANSRLRRNSVAVTGQSSSGRMSNRTNTNNNNNNNVSGSSYDSYQDKINQYKKKFNLDDGRSQSYSSSQYNSNSFGGRPRKRARRSASYSSLQTYGSVELITASSISPTHVQLEYDGQMCFWSLSEITVNNIKERFNIKKVALRDSTTEDLDDIIRPFENGQFPVYANKHYIIINMKEVPKISLKEKTINFLCQYPFNRQEMNKKQFSSTNNQMTQGKEERFVFKEDGTFIYTEIRGYSTQRRADWTPVYHFTGNWKIKSKTCTKLSLKFDKTKRKRLDLKKRKEDKSKIRKKLYSTFYIPGDGTIVVVTGEFDLVFHQKGKK
eukprot:TRINITY_DN604_c0_g1_i2.p1 TRINITY_DN604_c0_g1~~TRINITY_DN604_c0_g1_i2.p1  ORF type:complete len:397 (+),score=97.93 TRINITY_DN604_c0_g1_i2:54-1244(+)